MGHEKGKYIRSASKQVAAGGTEDIMCDIRCMRAFEKKKRRRATERDVHSYGGGVKMEEQ